MPSFKLYYFPIRGRGEPIRQLFALTRTKYEDVRFTMEQWAEFKNNTPFGEMPVLEVDGKMIPQSFAIARLIANEHGLAGSTPLEAAWVDAIADQWKDFHVVFEKFWYPRLGYGEGDLEALKMEYAIPARNKFFPILEKQLKESESKFLVGSSITWIDLLIADQVELISSTEFGFLDDYPEVLKHEKKIHAIPEIKRWIETRPKSKC